MNPTEASPRGRRTPEEPAAPPSIGPSASRSLAALLVVNVLATGVMLGILQWSVFFLLQSFLASTAIVYLLATAVWLLGSLLGMVLPGRQEALWLAGCVGCFYGFRAVAEAHTYALAWLPLLLLLVAGMGAYAGRFFRCRAAAFPATKWLFFLENTGFVAGLLLTAVCLYWMGASFFAAAPIAAAGVTLATGAVFMRAAPAEGP